MDVADAVAHALKEEGVEYLFAYPLNPLIEAAADVGIRTVVVRQERVGVHMADAVSRVTSGEQIGVFCMQKGPGSENAFGGVAQAHADSVAGVPEWLCERADVMLEAGAKERALLAVRDKSDEKSTGA